MYSVVFNAVFTIPVTPPPRFSRPLLDNPLWRRSRLSRRKRNGLLRVRARLPHPVRSAPFGLLQSQRDVELRLRGVPAALPVRHRSRRMPGRRLQAHSHRLLRRVSRPARLHRRRDDRLSAPHARVAVHRHEGSRAARRTVRALQVAAGGRRFESDARLGQCGRVEVVRPRRSSARSVGVAARDVPDPGAAYVAGAMHRAVPGVVRPERRPPHHAEGVGRLPGAGRGRHAGAVR